MQRKSLSHCDVRSYGDEVENFAGLSDFGLQTTGEVVYYNSVNDFPNAKESDPCQ